MKALVIAPSWLGDAVVSHSLIQKIFNKHGNKIDIVCRAYLVPVFKMMVEVGQVYSTQDKSGKLNLREKLKLAQQLKNTYDTAFILPNAFKAALIPWLAGIPKRIGWLGEYRWGLLNQIPNKSSTMDPQTIIEYCNLMQPYERFTSCLQPQLTINSTLKRENNLVAIAPGASFGPSKCWPPNYYSKIIRKLTDHGYRCMLLGSANDQSISQQIKFEQKSTQDFVGKISLQETLEHLSRARLLLCNDAGLMHVAAALQVPIVALFGATSIHKSPPKSSAASIVSLNLSCQPCQKKVCPLKHHQCLNDLSPEIVWPHIIRRLSS